MLYKPKTQNVGEFAYFVSLYRLIVKFDTYRNLQRHRAVRPAIARLSCLFHDRRGFYRDFGRVP